MTDARTPLRSSEMALPPAHLGHWWAYILYAVPLAVVIGSIVVTRAQDKRAARTEAEDRDRGAGARNGPDD